MSDQQPKLDGGTRGDGEQAWTVSPSKDYANKDGESVMDLNDLNRSRIFPVTFGTDPESIV